MSGQVCFILLFLPVFTALAEDVRKQNEEAAKYLTKFGYLSLSRSGNQDAKTAIKRFQKFFHLEQTGELDSATIDEMHKPRCGNPDFEIRGHRIRRYKTASKWRRTSLTYRFLNYGEDIPQSQVRSIIKEAFGYWSAVTPLRFSETSGRSDFTILFARRSHGDGAPFDGPSGVLAHAYFPENGRIHFDEDERYTSAQGGIHLLSVAVHEIGHAIGLHHSNVRGSIMWPSYNGYTPNLRLHQDDISGIQSLYGRGSGGGGGGGGDSCSDKSGSCQAYRNRGYCSSNHRYYSYMRTNCAKTCRFCGGEGGGGGRSCQDKHLKCQSWIRYCRTSAYVINYCKKTCRLC